MAPDENTLELAQGREMLELSVDVLLNDQRFHGGLQERRELQDLATLLLPKNAPTTSYLCPVVCQLPPQWAS